MIRNGPNGTYVRRPIRRVEQQGQQHDTGE